MPTIDPLQLEKVKKLLDDMDPETRAYAEAMIPLLWDKVEEHLDSLMDLLGGMSNGDMSTYDELIAKLKASNDASDALHDETVKANAMTRAFIRNLILLFITAQLGE